MSKEVYNAGTEVRKLEGLLRDAEIALECVWSGVSDLKRASLEIRTDIADTDITQIPVLWGTLKKVSEVLARIRAAKGKS